VSPYKKNPSNKHIVKVNSKRGNQLKFREYVLEHNQIMYDLINSRVFNLKSDKDKISKLLLLSKYHEIYKEDTIPKEILRKLGPLYDEYLELKSKDLSSEIDAKFYSNLFENNLPLIIFRTLDLANLPLKSDKELLVNCFNFNSRKFEEERKNLALKMLDLYSPISDIFGFKKILESIKDTAVDVLYPENYNQIKKFLYKNKMRLFQIKQDFQKKILKETIHPLNDLIKFSTFEDGSIIKGRVKAPGSIVLKMINEDLPPSKMLELHDLVAFTVLTDTEENARSLWELIKHDFQIQDDSDFCEDFISSPRGRTGYQALHVDVFFEGIRIEVQIKTPEMYLASERGEWAHAIYKNPSMKQSLLKLSEFFSVLENSSVLKNNVHSIDTRGKRFLAYYEYTKNKKINNVEIRLDKDSTVFDLVMLSKINKDPFKVKVYSKNTGVEVLYNQLVREGSTYVLKTVPEPINFNKKELKKKLYDLRACCVSGEANFYLTNLIKKNK
jgi:hypothetical protein